MVDLYQAREPRGVSRQAVSQRCGKPEPLEDDSPRPAGCGKNRGTDGFFPLHGDRQC
jgi:hypothetical protein